MNTVSKIFEIYGDVPFSLSKGKNCTIQSFRIILIREISVFIKHEIETGARSIT